MARGTDVTVGLVEDRRGQERAAEMVAGLEVCYPSWNTRGARFEEMGPDGVLTRQPGIALGAETTTPTCRAKRHEKRWQEHRRAAGCRDRREVDGQHPAPRVAQRRRGVGNGVVQRETVPDEVVRRAEPDRAGRRAPEALRRRMAHGNIYKAEKVDAALANYFRVGNLSALRELARYLARRAASTRAWSATAPTTASTAKMADTRTGSGRARPPGRRDAAAARCSIASRGAGGGAVTPHRGTVRRAGGPPLPTLATLRRLTDELGDVVAGRSGRRARPRQSSTWPVA